MVERVQFFIASALLGSYQNSKNIYNDGVNIKWATFSKVTEPIIITNLKENTP